MTLQLLRTVAFFLVAAGVVAPAFAAPVVDQQQLSFRDPPFSIETETDIARGLAQTFMVGVSGGVTTIRLPVICESASATVSVSIRELVDGEPTGPVRGVATATGAGPGGPPPTMFVDFTFSPPVMVASGEVLAFVVTASGPCHLALGPTDDPYPDGDAWLQDWGEDISVEWMSFEKRFPADGATDFVFQIVVDDAWAPPPPPPAPRNCVISGITDPVTGATLELPISYFLPVCRCLEDSGAREFRCAILHPDFFAIRRIPLPLSPGKPYEEIWQIAPLTRLDGSIRIDLKGGGLKEPAQFVYSSKTKLPAQVKALAPQSGQTFRVQAIAPEKPEAIPGVAVIQYDMQDVQDDALKRFEIDISIDESFYDQ